MSQAARSIEPKLLLGCVEGRSYRISPPALPDNRPLPVAIRALSGDAKGRAATSIAPLSRRATDTTERPLRVLVVEDEAIIALEIEFVLQDLGAELVGVAMTAAEAVDLAHLHRPDCVTMDINIKGDRDGVSAAIEIYEKLGIRSVFVSAYGNAETRARAGAARPFGWIQKPIATEDLKAALERVPDAD